MPFKNRNFAKRITKKKCEWCGWEAGPRHAAHIIDEVNGSDEWNVLSLCPNCHSIFEDIIRPKLYDALHKFGSKKLPLSWKTSPRKTAGKN